METAKSSVVGFGKDAKSATGFVHGLEKQIDALKASAGRGSALDDIGKVFKGGGAVIGITQIGEELSKATAKMVELNGEFRKGQLDSSGIAVKIGESLPIIGSFVTAGQSIREMFTHQKEQADDVTAAVKRQGEVYAEQYKIKQEAAEKIYKLQRETQGNDDAAGGIGRTGINQKVYQIDVEYKAKKGDLEHQVEQDILKANEEVKKQTEKLYADLDDMKKRRANSTDGSDVANELDTHIAEAQGEVKTLQATNSKNIADIQAAAAKDQASADDLHVKKLQEARDLATIEAKQKGDLIALEASQQGRDLSKQGFTEDDFKKLKEMQDAHQDTSGFTGQVISNAAAEGAKGLAELHDRLAAVQAAAAAGIDPKFAEEVQKMHLSGSQAKDFEATSQAIEDATRKAQQAIEDATRKAQQAKDEMKQIAEQKAVLKALQEGKDPEAAEEKNPELAALKSQIDLVRKRNELLGEIPIEKAKAALADINRELTANLITPDQARQLQAKVISDYNSETKPEKALDVKAEQSRSVKDLAQTPKANNDVQKLLQLTRQSDLQGQMTTFLQQIWQKFTGVSADQGSDSVSLNSLA
jgi:hypothetical protein